MSATMPGSPLSGSPFPVPCSHAPCQWPAGSCPVHAPKPHTPGAPIPFPPEPDFSEHFDQDGDIKDKHNLARAVERAITEGRADRTLARRWLRDTIHADKVRDRTDLALMVTLRFAQDLLALDLPWMTEAIWTPAENCWEPEVLYHQSLQSPRRFRRPIPENCDLAELRRMYELSGRPDISRWPQSWQALWLEDYPGYPDADTMWDELEAQWHAQRPPAPPEWEAPTNPYGLHPWGLPPGESIDIYRQLLRSLEDGPVGNGAARETVGC